ncbi:uncharacterized protein LOC114522730 [Dendronephthya gigantea]|uniref:uncharacterized protein LOC114522730 n=1 Tax=Dendronephthya gigantea TaxID=151771 RepID=UPI00106C70BD|nr:uncharacterized protein LOC114522730 [Dendronephthya gigantea]
MKIFTFEILLYCCVASQASISWRRRTPPSENFSKRQISKNLGPLQVKYGQITFDAEGNDIPTSRYFSRKPHVPNSASGITIGRGYDLKHRSQTQVYSDLSGIGLSRAIARAFSKGVHLTGQTARNFLKRNNLQSSVITHEQQKKLFYIAYDPIAADARRLATKPDVQRAYGRTNWALLNNAIKDVVVDLRYRGDYTPTTRRMIQRAIVANDLQKFTLLMSDSNYWLNTIRVPRDRFLRRKNALIHAG